jgi:hypothetical protein
MVIYVKRTNQKNHVSFMPHTFNQSENHFGQCGHFSQVEKLWFFVVNVDQNLDN